MGAWYSEDQVTRSAKWKLPAVSALAAVLTVTSCGQFESFTKRRCTKGTTVIVLSPLPTVQKKNARRNNSGKGTTCRTTTRSITFIFETSSSGYAATFPKKFGTFIVANMGTKISDPTIMPVCLMSISTIRRCTRKRKA